MPNVKEITTLLSSPSRKDLDLIERAYIFARRAHAGEKRYSGEPYFNHVHETAKIIAKLGMDSETIAAGLLHDSVEDAGVERESIQSQFGDDILFLIEGVTKLGKLRFSGVKRHVESLRKLFIATSFDIRVLIIKLSDRLHNMRTLEFVPKEKQRRIAEETMEVYVPIAHRLGIELLRTQLEDLAFQYIDPKEYKNVKRLAEKKHKKSIESLEKVHERLKEALKKEKIYKVKIDYRLKNIYSLYRKLKRKEMDIDRVYDIAALRIIVPTISDCYKVLGVVHSLWRPLPGRIKDYIAVPKPNGYQSIHTSIFTRDGAIAEIQIRTQKMNLSAEYGVASHAKYKGGEEGKKTANWLAQFFSQNKGEEPTKEIKKNAPEWIKELAETQQNVTGVQEFLDNLQSDFFRYRIFVFTPKGDVIDLPADSTPIDFAYHIHSDIGDHTSGAKVNGKLVTLDTPLKNGDIVEIITRKGNKPTRKWLLSAKTTLAKRRIRSSLQK